MPSFWTPNSSSASPRSTEQRASLQLDPESLRLLEFEYKKFVHSGANLSPADKEKLKKLNEEESTLSTAFESKLLAAAKAAAYVTADKSALAGLSDAEIAAAAETAKERKVQGYVIPLQNTTQQPDLATLSNRSTRQAIFENSWTRAERGGAQRYARHHRAPGPASRRKGQASRLPELRRLEARGPDGQESRRRAEVHERARARLDGQSRRRSQGHPGPDRFTEGVKEGSQQGAQQGGFPLQPWDWEFYSEQVRKAKYDLDQSQIKPYLELNNVLQNGLFFAANQLYGLTFKERHDIPVYQPDVRVFEVLDANGKSLALWYCDYFKRDNKNGGAWMDNFVARSKLLNTLPVVYNVANFSKPAPGQPALLSFDDVTTMFHEFGHALHAMFADTEYPSLAGTDVPNDFVEFPSQFNEHWASYPAVFNHYAKHYKTGAPMPAELVAKIKKSKTFNQGYEFTELLAAAQLDMQWHTLPSGAPLKIPTTSRNRPCRRPISL